MKKQITNDLSVELSDSATIEIRKEIDVSLPLGGTYTDKIQIDIDDELEDLIAALNKLKENRRVK